MRLLLITSLAALALAAPVAEAKDVVVYVCGKDLCRVAPGARRPAGRYAV